MDLLLKITIAVATLGTTTMLMTKAYFEMETARIKSKTAKREKENNPEEITNTVAHSQNVTSYVTGFEKIVMVLQIIFLVIVVIFTFFFPLSYILVLATMPFALFWFLYVWLSALTRMFGDEKTVIQNQSREATR